MTTTPKQLFQGAITAAVVTKYTVPAATTAILKSFDVCNTTGNRRNLRIFLVPSGGAAGSSNAIAYDYSMTAGSIFGWEGEQVLATGDFIAVQADAAGLTITASGVEIT